MNEQAKESITLPTIISFLVSVKNTVIGHQVKLLPFGKAFLGLHPPGNLGLLLLVATVCLTTGGCSTALITVGVLDKPEQEQMFSAMDRAGLEALAKKPIASRTSVDGKTVDLYSYLDGEAGVIGKRRAPMHGARLGMAFSTLMLAGYGEVIAVPAALIARSRATREFYVVYAPDNRILAICYPQFAVNISDREQSLCDNEPAPLISKDH